MSNNELMFIWKKCLRNLSILRKCRWKQFISVCNDFHFWTSLRNQSLFSCHHFSWISSARLVASFSEGLKLSRSERHSENRNRMKLPTQGTLVHTNAYLTISDLLKYIPQRSCCSITPISYVCCLRRKYNLEQEIWQRLNSFRI